MIARPLSKLAAFFASVWLVRYLGNSLGILDTALGFVALFTYVSDFGAQHFVIREVSRDKSAAGAYLSNFLSLQVLLGVFLLALMVLVVNVVGKYEAPVKHAVYLSAVGLIVTSMYAPFKAVFHAHEAIHISAVVGGVLVLTEAILTFGGILFGGWVQFFAARSIVSGLVVVGIGYVVCRERFVFPRFGMDAGLWWRMLKMSFPFALLLGMSIIYKRIDIQMLYAMKGKLAVGYYSAVVRLVTPLLLPAQTIMTAVYPLLSRRHVNSQESFRFAVEKTLKYVGALAIPMAVGAFLLADRIVLLLYREAFRASIPALQILSWTLAVGSINIVITFCVVASGRVLMPAAFNAAGALANVALNLILIPRYSFEGAAVATLVCEVALMVVLICYMLRSRVAAFPWVDTAKSLFAAASMAGLVLLCRSASIFVVIPAAGVVYFGVLLLLRFLVKEEKEILKSAVLKR